LPDGTVRVTPERWHPSSKNASESGDGALLLYHWFGAAVLS
jgi:hypothetical protein